MSKSADTKSNVVGSPSVMRMKTVVQLTGLSRASIYRLMGTDEFPRSFKIGKTASGWLAAEIHSWINDRALSRHSFSSC